MTMRCRPCVSKALTVATGAVFVVATASIAQADTPSAEDGGISGYFADWFTRVDAAQASQPHWITPLATVTPRLEEELRYDQSWQHLGNGDSLHNFGGGKGLELIPTRTNEVILNLPPYEERGHLNAASGLGDDPILLIKQRLLSADEQNGNYILSAFLGVQAPTSAPAFTSHAWLVTPTIAAGKGVGKFDVQATLGAALPTSHEGSIGKSVLANAALQYHLGRYFWPEVEVNATSWYGGARDGKTQVYITPGIVFGRFRLGGRLKANFGIGYQFAASPTLTTKPVLTPSSQHAWLLSARVSF